MQENMFNNAALSSVFSKYSPAIIVFLSLLILMVARLMVTQKHIPLSHGWGENPYVNHFIPRNSFNWNAAPVERPHAVKIKRTSIAKDGNGEQLFWNAFQRSEPLVSNVRTLTFAYYSPPQILFRSHTCFHVLWHVLRAEPSPNTVCNYLHT